MHNPFRCFNSSPEVIRLTAMMHIRYPLSLRHDDSCLQPALLMKQAINSSGLLVLPRTGHTINLEEPGAFNQGIAEFFAQVDAGRWTERDPRSLTTSILGTRDT